MHENKVHLCQGISLVLFYFTLNVRKISPVGVYKEKKQLAVLQANIMAEHDGLITLFWFVLLHLICMPMFLQRLYIIII